MCRIHYNHVIYIYILLASAVYVIQKATNMRPGHTPCTDCTARCSGDTGHCTPDLQRCLVDSYGNSRIPYKILQGGAP